MWVACKSEREIERELTRPEPAFSASSPQGMLMFLPTPYQHPQGVLWWGSRVPIVAVETDSEHAGLIKYLLSAIPMMYIYEKEGAGVGVRCA